MLLAITCSGLILSTTCMLEKVFMESVSIRKWVSYQPKSLNQGLVEYKDVVQSNR